MAGPSATSSLRLEKQFAGENINLWGDHLNVDFDLIDSAIAGFTSLAVNAAVSLTSVNYASDQARSAMLKFTGTGGFTVTIPSVSKSYLVWNAATAAVTISTGSGSTVIVEPAAKVCVFCDGTNVVELGYSGYGLKDYIDQAVLAATGSLPATTGNDGKVLACVTGAWTPTALTTSYITSFSATAAQTRTGTTTAAALTPGDTYSALAPVALTSSGNSIAVDMSTFINATHTFTENTTLANPTNTKQSQSGWIDFTQHASSAKTLAFGSNWKRVGGAATITSTTSARAILVYQVITSTLILYDLLNAPS